MDANGDELGNLFVASSSLRSARPTRPDTSIVRLWEQEAESPNLSNPTSGASRLRELVASQIVRFEYVGGDPHGSRSTSRRDHNGRRTPRCGSCNPDSSTATTDGCRRVSAGDEPVPFRLGQLPVDDLARSLDPCARVERDLDETTRGGHPDRVGRGVVERR